MTFAKNFQTVTPFAYPLQKMKSWLEQLRKPYSEPPGRFSKPKPLPVPLHAGPRLAAHPVSRSLAVSRGRPVFLADAVVESEEPADEPASTGALLLPVYALNGTRAETARNAILSKSGLPEAAQREPQLLGVDVAAAVGVEGLEGRADLRVDLRARIPAKPRRPAVSKKEHANAHAMHPTHTRLGCVSVALARTRSA